MEAHWYLREHLQGPLYVSRLLSQSLIHSINQSGSQQSVSQSVTHLIGQKLSNKQVIFYPRSYKIQYQTLYLDMCSY